MPDQSDETQKQQRRSTASPPFFAPRTSRPTTPSQSATATPPRRTLFTPPGVPKQQPAFTAPLAAPRVTPFAAPIVSLPPSAPALDAAHEPPPLPVVNASVTVDEVMAAEPEAPTGAAVTEQPAAAGPASMPNAATPSEAGQGTLAHDAGEGFVIERYETPPISLSATGEQGVVSDDPSVAFQVYDDASRLLERGARPAPSEAGGLEIERTEVAFDAAAADVAPLEVESFWASQAMPQPEAPRDAPQPPLGDESVVEPRAAEPAPEPPAAVAPQAPDDADEALAEAFAEPAPNESVPRWATPRMVPAVEHHAPSPHEAWDVPAVPPPPDELAAALAWPDSGLRARTPAAGIAAHGETGDTSHELAASAEGWPLSVSGRPGMPDTIAEALEHIAQRVRAGEVPLPADVALARSDESALALTLAALLRAGASPRA